MDAVPWEFLGGLTPPALLGLAVWLILTGRIVPKATYESMERSRDHWQETALKSVETIAVQARTIEKQTVIGDTATKVMDAVQEAREAGTP